MSVRRLPSASNASPETKATSRDTLRPRSPGAGAGLLVRGRQNLLLGAEGAGHPGRTRGRIGDVPAIRLAQEPAADELPGRDPLALLIGMLLDQQMRQRSTGRS